MSPVGKRLKQLREAAGLTQQELAFRAGLSVSNLSQIEQGKKADPRASTLLALARALGVTMESFFEPAEEAKPPRRPRGKKK
jgi:transcriptional regulator with XRE-family HTH domain